MDAAPLAPTPDSERIHALDAMRGVAILGVLVAYTVWSLGNPPDESWSAADHWIERGMDLFVDNKFLSMFACLFGLGVAQQWRRWEAAGRDPGPLHLRRMGFLLAIGLVHGALLRNGDILAPYALMGLVLLAFRRASNRVIVAAAVCFTLMPWIVTWIAAAIGHEWPHRPSGGDSNYVVENLRWLGYWYRTNPLLYWPSTMTLMLVGLLFGRTRVVERLIGDRALALRMLVVTAVLALAFRLAYDRLVAASLAKPYRVYVRSLFEFGAWIQAMAYGTAIILVVRQASPGLGPLRAVGRMAFTNYLSQAVIIVPLCLALGWFDRVSPVGGVVMAVSLAVLQIVYSTWWLRSHSMGPLEHFWRGVTYGPRFVRRGALR